MPRSKDHCRPAAEKPSPPDQPFIIHPTAAYRVHHLWPLGLTKNSLKREVRLGRLRASKRGGRYYFLGAWVLKWLEAGEVRPKTKDRARQAEAN